MLPVGYLITGAIWKKRKKSCGIWSTWIEKTSGGATNGWELTHSCGISKILLYYCMCDDKTHQNRIRWRKHERQI